MLQLREGTAFGVFSPPGLGGGRRPAARTGVGGRPCGCRERARLLLCLQVTGHLGRWEPPRLARRPAGTEAGRAGGAGAAGAAGAARVRETPAAVAAGAAFGGEFVNNRLAFGGLTRRRRPRRRRLLAVARSDRARANWERGHPAPAARGGRRCRRRRRAQCARGGAGGGGGCSRRRRPGQRGPEARRAEPSAARRSAAAGGRPEAGSALPPGL